MKRLADHGIVLRRVNFGEKDRIVTFLSSESGKISLFAKGVRAQKSKLSSGIELLNVNEITFIEGKGKLSTLLSSRLIVSNNKIVANINKTTLCFETLKRINDLIEDDHGQEYYAHLEKYLRAMSTDSFDYRLVQVWFDFKIMTLSGVLSELSVDSKDSDYYSFEIETQKFVAHTTGDYEKNDIKLLRVLKDSNAPVKLQNSYGFEDKLLNFSANMLKNNLS